MMQTRLDVLSAIGSIEPVGVIVGALSPVIHAAFLAQSTGLQSGPFRSSSWKIGAAFSSSPDSGAQQQTSPLLQEEHVQTVWQVAPWAGAALSWIAGNAGIATSAYQTTIAAENQVERNTPRTDIAAFRAGRTPANTASF